MSRYNSRWLLETVEKFVGRPFPSLNFVGGGAQSELWCQILADVLDRPIRQMEHPVHANTRGAALLASRHAQAHHASTTSAARLRSSVTFQPDPSTRAVYDPVYKEFRAIYKQNKAIYARLNRHG